MAALSLQAALYQVSVRWVRYLPLTSFRFRVTTDTLVSLARRFPLLGLVRDLHPLDNTHASQTKTPNHHYDDLDEEDEVVTPKKHHRLRDRIYLTHIMWFGLRNQKYQLFEGTTTIGRYDEIDISDIMIRGDETMSRKSAAIIIEEEDGIYDYKLKVLNATNKVTVNNQRIKEGSETYLDFGDIIILGNSKFKFDNH